MFANADVLNLVNSTEENVAMVSVCVSVGDLQEEGVRRIRKIRRHLSFCEVCGSGGCQIKVCNI